MQQEDAALQQGRTLVSWVFGNAPLLLILTMLAWAGNTVVARGVHEFVPPLTLAWFRWTIAAGIIMPFAWPHLKRDWPEIKASWRTLPLLAVLGTGTFVSLYYIGLSKTTAINGLIINSAVPIMIPLAVFAIYRDMIRPIQALGVLLSLTGVLIVLTRGQLELITSLEFHEGDLWVLAAMTVWAFYTALLRERPKIHWSSFAAFCFVVGSLVNFPFFVGEMLSGKLINPTFEAFLAIAYVSTLPSLTAQVFFFRAVGLIGSNRAGVYMHLIPFFGAILAIIFLGEKLFLFHIGAFALILCGVWLASRPDRVIIPIVRGD
jgi:drug/metabolite transporter (DMT)-like permease